MQPLLDCSGRGENTARQMQSVPNDAHTMPMMRFTAQMPKEDYVGKFCERFHQNGGVSAPK